MANGIDIQTIYDDVEELTQRVTALESAVANLNVEDTGWINLTLKPGVLPYNSNGTPQYRKIGNKVYIRGAVKNILERDTIIGTLPEGFRPLHGAHSYVQNTSMANYAANFSRIAVQTDGDIVIEGVNSTGSFGSEKYFPIHTEFLLD